MPELPEVNTVQKYFNSQTTGLRIQHVEVHDAHIIRNLSGHAFTEKLEGQTITGSYRQGKYLFAALQSGHYVQLHLGMTGDIMFYTDQEDRPRFERFCWHLSDGQYVGFDDQRKFGRILYLEDLQTYLQEIGLGPDALAITEEAFLNQMDGRTTQLKVFLIDQHILAGIGNLYADEICYQTRIHPASRIFAIPKRKRKEIYRKMRAILEYTCAHDAYYGIYPEDWFWKWRKAGLQNPNGHGKVEVTKIGGRSTYFAKGWQKLYSHV